MQRAFIILLRGKFLFTGGIFILLFSLRAGAQTFTAGAQTQSASDSGTIVYNLQQCIDSALKNNPTVKQSGFLKESAKVTYDQQRGTMLPSVSGYASFANNGGRSINIYTNSYITSNYNSGYYQLQGNLPLWNGF